MTKFVLFSSYNAFGKKCWMGYWMGNYIMIKVSWIKRLDNTQLNNYSLTLRYLMNSHYEKKGTTNIKWKVVSLRNGKTFVGNVYVSRERTLKNSISRQKHPWELVWYDVIFTQQETIVDISKFSEFYDIPFYNYWRSQIKY